MNLQHYFGRIGYKGSNRPSFESLRALQAAHVCAVPFENIDVQLGRMLTTDVEPAYEKIVLNRRGGWCYEQNGLFGWALSEIGFDVTRLAADVMRQERGDAASANHLCLQVRVPGTTTAYLVDVGFGGSLIEPITLEEHEYAQVPFRLGLKKLPDDDWRFWEDAGDGEFSFDFSPRRADEAALSKKCDELQTDPESGFVLNLVAQIRSNAQHKTLRGRVFSAATADGISRRTIDSVDEFLMTLTEDFHLDVPEIADLWPRITARHEHYLNEHRAD